MKRLALFACALFVTLATSASAAPITFRTSEGKSSVDFECTNSLQNNTCNIGEADVDFDKDDDRLLDPSATFQFLKFEAKGTEKDNKSKDGGDSFFATATLAFKINTIWYKVTSTGTGTFETKGGEFTSFSIIWTPIANLFIEGVGTLSVVFEDLNYTRDGKRRMKHDHDEDDDEYEGEDDLYVNATISAVPLPAGGVLLLSGLALLGAARLRRRALN